MPLFKISIFLCLGIALTQVVPIKDLPVSYGFYASTILFGLSLLLIKYRRLASCCIYLLFLLFGYLVFTSNSYVDRINHFSNYDNQILILQVKERKVGKKKDQLFCTVNYVLNADNKLTPTKGNILVYTQKSNETNSGDILFINKKYFELKAPTNPHTFDYKKHLSHKDIYHNVHIDTNEVLIIKPDRVNPFIVFSNNIKKHINSSFERNIKSEQNIAILKAMILGNRDELDDELNQKFSETGAIHILAVSGLHVGIIAIMIMKLLSLAIFRIPKSAKFLLALFGIWSYVILTGCGAPAVRAAIMLSFYLSGPVISKSPNTYNSIGIAAIAIMLFDPKQIFTLSFQFSFLALLSIIMFYPKMESWITSENKLVRFLWKFSALSFSAQILLFPLIVFYFNKFPMYFWLSGIIAVPAAMFIINAAMALIILSLLKESLPILEELAGLGLDYFMKGMMTGIDYIHNLPFHLLDNIWISSNHLLIIYCSIVSLIFGYFQRQRAYIYIGLFFCFAYGLAFHLDVNRNLRKQKLIVYDFYDKTHIEKYSNACHHVLLSKNTDENFEERNLKRSRLSNYAARQCISDTLEYNHIGIHSIADQLILINPTENIYNYKIKTPIDLLIITDNNSRHAEKLVDTYQINQVVLKSSNWKERNLMKTLCEEHNLKFYDVKENGAFIKEYVDG